MDKTKKIEVVNPTKNEILLVFPDIKFRRVFPAGANFKIPFEILEEAIYDHGFSVCLEKGALYINDKEARIELGLESEGDTETNKSAPKTKLYTKAQLLKILKVDTIESLKETLDGMNQEQILSLVDLAIAEKYSDYAKAELLKEKSGYDIIKGIQLKKQNEEVIKE